MGQSALAWRPGNAFDITNAVSAGEEIFFSVTPMGAMSMAVLLGGPDCVVIGGPTYISPPALGQIMAGDTLRFAAEPAPTDGNSISGPLEEDGSHSYRLPAASLHPRPVPGS